MSDYTGGEDGYVPLMGASHNFVDVNTLARHENPNYEGTPTQFFDDQGNLKAVLADLNGQGSGQQTVDPYSFNPILKEGEKISADTARQATNDQGQLLFLDNEGNQTTRPTGTPMVGGTIRDVMYEKDPGSRGGFLPSDTYQGMALLATMMTAGALGPALLAGEGAAGGAGALGTIGGDIGAFTTADAAASVAGEGAFNMASALGMPLDQAVNAGLISSSGELTAAGTETLMGMGGEATGAAGFSGLSGGLTDAEASALMGQYEQGALGGYGAQAGTGLSLADALKYAKMGLSGASLLGGLLGGGGSPGAGGGGSGSGYGPSGYGPSGYGPSGSGSSTVAYSPNGPWNAPINPGMFMTGLRQQTPVTAGTEHLKMLFPELDPALARQFAMSGNTGSNLGGNYFAYGSSPPSSSSPLSEVDMFPGAAPMRVKDGGTIQAFRDGGAPHIPEFITGATGHYVKGRGDGQSDDIPAMLADGEYVFDADTVAQLGNGSSDAGAKVLDKMREALRHHKRSAPVDSIPPKAKSPLEYIKLGMKRN